VELCAATDPGVVREHNEDSLLVADLSTSVRLRLQSVPRATSEDGKPPVGEGTAVPPPDASSNAQMVVTVAPEVDSGAVPVSVRRPLGPRGQLLVVCDGMGGAAAGEVASRMAVEVLYERLVAAGPTFAGVESVASALREAVFEANHRIATAAAGDSSLRGMGTTLTAAVLYERQLLVAQVGDSRGYLVRGGQIVQVTRDQSLAEQLVESGELTAEEARTFEHGHVILQALGVVDDVCVPISVVPLRRGDLVLLCSDGMSGPLADDELLSFMGASSDVATICQQLVARARSVSGVDNITGAVARVDGALEEPGSGPIEFSLLELPESAGSRTGQREAVRDATTSIRRPPVEAAGGGTGDGEPGDGSVQRSPSRRSPSAVFWWVVVVILVGAGAMLLRAPLLLSGKGMH
jgi:protein phosphatase